MDVVNFLLGILASFIAWLVIGVVIKPRISLSNKIKKKAALIEEGFIYSIDVINNSYFFNVYDITLRGRLMVKGLSKNNLNDSRSFIIKVGSGSSPYISAKRKNNNQKSFVIKIHNSAHGVNSGDIGQLLKLYNSQNTDMQIRKIFIEEALLIKQSASLEISVICTHAFSGARKVVSKIYKYDDIEW